MALTKVTGKGITCSAVTEDKLGTSSVTTNKINNDAVTSAKINNGAVTADDLASTLDLSSKTLTLPSDVVADAKRPVQDNIALLGFKMAVNDGLTVFNLVDGVVDEFNDESGTDESEGTNDLYCGTSDYYINSNTPDATPVAGACYSAGFSMTAITEPDTSTAGTNPGYGLGSMGIYTVPSCISSVDIKVWGSGGGGSDQLGGGGGFASGTLAVTPGQTIYVSAGEGGAAENGGGVSPIDRAYLFSGSKERDFNTAGGGLSGTFNADLGQITAAPAFGPYPGVSAPQAYIIAGSGGGAGGESGGGGAGGGLTGCGGSQTTEQTAKANACRSGGGGGQAVGGQGGDGTPCGPSGQTGGLFLGGSAASPSNDGAGSGGAGYYGGGGGGGGPATVGFSGGGGSSYYGHPQVTSGATEEGANQAGGGTADPAYVAGSNEGGSASQNGENGYVLISASVAPICATTTSTTIVSSAFTSTSVATSARIVVFEENVDTPTLNTDIIASVSRDGTNFTNATLSDSGYVTGSSGQRILTGQADISGQPSGQSMRWKLALANNTVKIHGVALQWS